MKRFLCILFLLPVLASAQSWNASVVNKERIGQRIDITVTYSNGARSIQESYTFDGSSDIGAELQSRVDQHLAKLTAIDAGDVAVKPGAVTPTPKPIDPEPTPNPLKEYSTLLAHYRALKRAASDGVIDPNDKAVTDALAQLRTDYKPEYADLF